MTGCAEGSSLKEEDSSSCPPRMEKMEEIGSLPSSCGASMGLGVICIPE